MAQIEGEITIGRPVEEVFDFVADERNEPRFNRQMSSTELLTPEPIGNGSRFHAELRMMRRTVDMTVECTQFERPRLLGSTSRSATRGGRGRAMLTSGTLTFEPVPRGTRMRWAWQVETPRRMKILAPVIVRMGRRQEQRIWGGQARFRVKYRLGGRESVDHYAGSFTTRREALARRGWVAGELAAMRVPDLRALQTPAPRTPTLAEVAERWRASRLDVTEGTAVGHRVQLARVLPTLGTLRVDEITTADVAELVTGLHAEGRKRETIRKSVTVLAQVLDFAGIKDNPARDRVHVRLAREERDEPTPPTADQIEAVLNLMPRAYALAVLVLDATGMRVGELEEKGLCCGDLDEPNVRWRIRRAVEKGRHGRWVSVPPDLFAAVIATLPPREDRAAERPVFPGLTQERLRTAIARACKASATPTWSPHDLRHRRISLWHRQGETWALIGARVGQRSLSVTADTYTHVLLDDRELDHARLVAPTAE